VYCLWREEKFMSDPPIAPIVKSGILVRFVTALNSLNQPWVAITVIVIGMFFDIICKRYGVANDAATGVIGAGVGLLTGQGLNRAAEQHTVPTQPGVSLPEPQPATKK
jgi:hypothetical protein